MSDKIILSNLGHTWLIDLDGTVVKHNGYKDAGCDSLLPGAKDFFNSIPEKDKIVLLTSRNQSLQGMTESFLLQNGIRFDYVLYDLPFGERILINDKKPSGLCMSLAISKERDEGLSVPVVIDNSL